MDDPTARWIGRVLLVCGVVGAAASFALVLERIALWENPLHVPSCTIDAVLSCGSVMTSAQSELFGFPNSLIGLATFPVVAAVGVASIGGGGARVLWLGLQAGATAGVVFVHWLIGQSVVAIGALCPYCMVVWVVTITAFWYTTLHNALSGRLVLPSRWRALAVRAGRVHGAVLATWFVLIGALVAVRFWEHWTGAGGS
ncbi:vitamin K epoxide reductase family protein [Actinomycetes bacterium KLBMP 9759]